MQCGKRRVALYLVSCTVISLWGAHLRVQPFVQPLSQAKVIFFSLIDPLKSKIELICHTMQMMLIYCWKSVSVKCGANVLISKKVIKDEGSRT